ncbi:2-oxoglutarate-Fe(II) type oxidoreductase ppzD-like [Penaeus japonicus]|uniref:2-oxoglutarate-Fe(II) type oxidoreductase ppzD-like n=1 Tax=Penaeus japonicus TaxID=27405 RepID=UPI001C712D18|nr:2-oxoglutarate-Fe(II) type oxidoreductase ppzD-like [Penaeus japonicus]XP_042883839.1 2-oxoglutarate-Fe(II) type oxidoreductase ppzD-like [Penaeus japonicus]XP_042883846.1 2-oxoglutarate-Fe(II) type oxidoreductase ppzD-like [Penaeus japonicus]XP_042883850.1 2-oxoglutarate-Fe(II) type oxidoreductase ppzD-like [Penaeus japonicus]
MSTQGIIPVVDLGQLSLSHDGNPSPEEWQRVGQAIAKNFTDIGFVYLTSHGVPETQISSLVASGSKFFDLDLKVKNKYPRNPEKQQGYVEVDREKFDPAHFKHELREAYDVKRSDGVFPDEEVPFFRRDAESFINTCKALSLRLLKAVAVGLDLDESFFVDTHQEICSDNNASCMRLLHYPPVPEAVPAEAIRCGAHTDYGTITLLFQDDIGGLQVRDRNNEWVNADPLPGAILVNVGDILQFWTADKFVATEHRVLIPEEEKRMKTSRRSVVFFVHPDDPVLIKPLGSSSAYPPVTAREHVLRRFKETYTY